jgi:hypothetical protein
MRLDDWIALSPDERRSRRDYWKNPALLGQQQAPDETEWLALLHEAADRFARRYGDMPEVLYVGRSYWFDIQHPIAITARTRLSRGQELSELPAEYATFPVRQEPVGEDIQAHKDTWSVVLGRLFGWDRATIADFVAGQEWVWRNGFFLHDPACEVLPRLTLARSALQSWRAYDEGELSRIGEELVRAIGGGFYLHGDPDYDWQAAQQRIAHIRQRYERGRTQRCT